MLGVRAALALATVALALAAPASGASVWDGDGPWGPYGWDAERGRFHQPRLAAPTPEPAPLGALDQEDFDSDGVANTDDNCLLVANPSQRLAVAPSTQAERRAYRRDYGPRDTLRIARRWKAEHPGARFLTDAELGEACSGYDGNYMRTVGALIALPHAVKLDVFRYLGRSGPMFGGAADPFPDGKPTSYDRFGTATDPPDLEASPTTGKDLARDADGSLAAGHMVPSMPMCSGYRPYVEFGRWLLGLGDSGPLGKALAPVLDELQEQGRALFRRYEERIGCGSGLQRTVWEQAMRHFWAGKRLYTNSRWGRITNRFVASVTEHPLCGGLVRREPFNSIVERTGLVPYADHPETTCQSRHGIIFRGRSSIDGRDAILMDWRGFEAAWPLGPGSHVEGLLGMLIYDECRAIQTGVYNCTAVTDWAIGERRHTFQEGYMPWVVKGPPSIDEYIAAAR